MEYSEKVEGSLFRIQALPAEQTLELIQGAALMYSDPDKLGESVHKVLASRYELNDSIECIETATHDGGILDSVQEIRVAVRRFDEAIDKSATLLLKGQKPEGMEVLMNRCTQLETALAASVARLRNVCTIVQSHKLDDIRMLDDQRIATDRKVLFWLLAGSLVVGLGFALFL
jgi:hypothetical protein